MCCDHIRTQSWPQLPEVGTAASTLFRAILFCGDINDPADSRHSFFNAIATTHRTLVESLGVAPAAITVLYACGARPNTPAAAAAGFDIDGTATKAELQRVLNEVCEIGGQVLVFLCGHGRVADPANEIPACLHCVQKVSGFVPDAVVFRGSCSHLDGNGRLVPLLLPAGQPLKPKGEDSSPSVAPCADFASDTMLEEELVAILGSHPTRTEIHVAVHSCYSGIFSTAHSVSKVASFTSSTNDTQEMFWCDSDPTTWKSVFSWAFHMGRGWIDAAKLPSSLPMMKDTLQTAFSHMCDCDPSRKPEFL